MNLSNETVSEYFIPYYMDPLNFILKAVGTVSSLVGLIGNFVVLMLIFGSNKFRRPANFFVANLSFTSIVYVLVTNLRFYAGRPNDPLNEYNSVCLFGAFLPKFTHALIAFTSMAIVLDRNYRVNHPMSTPSKGWLLKIILCIWFASVVMTIPRIFMYGIKIIPADELSGLQGQRQCIKEILWGISSLHVAYLIIYLSIVTFLPVGASIFGLVQILKVINGLSFCLQFKGTNNNIRFRILRNTFIFSILFIIGWGPSGVIMCLTEFPPDLMPDVIRRNFTFFKYFNIIGFVQNCLNPILLFVLSSDLRQYFYETKKRLCHV